MANETNNTEDKVVDNQYFIYDGSNDYKDEKGKEKRSEELINKYKEMADMRRDYEDIDIRDCIPTLEEMVQDDLMYELLEAVANGDTEKDVCNTAFYTQEPFTMETGYKDDQNVFIFKIPKITIPNKFIELNIIDGDTFRVPLDSIHGVEKSFNMRNGESYSSFKEYCYTKGLVDKKAAPEKQNLQIRLIGVDCPEIPHLDVQVMKPTDIVTMTITEAKRKGANMLRYTFNPDTDKKPKDRVGSDKVDFYRVQNSSGKYSYHEILGDGKKFFNASEIKDNLEYKKIVVYDDSKKDTLAGGYRARDNMVDLLRNGNVYVMLDANGIKANKTSSKYKLYYNHWWNAVDSVKDMIDQWCTHTNETTLTKLSYSPFGTDGHGRFVGAAFAPREGIYANIAKYNIADTETHSIANPDFSGSPELGNLGGDNAAAFELYTYEKNNQLWLDSFSEMTKESYNMRLEFHKQVTGIDFTKVRNCTMMLGDTLFLIPPQNIRSLSSIDYEKVGIMRGKGSMVKNNTNREMFVEVDLYFYDKAGINGIPTEVSMPNGKKVTYYMNGLRSLIAQFKVAPYLPIENQFINDILGIEAVSLVNLNVSTVEGYPRLLQATLTLRDFNYRIYMPDVPIDYSANQSAGISSLNPIFAKCFNWELFRYYYQRMISFGNLQKSDFEYNTFEYNKELYSKKEVLQPVGFCRDASTLSFYTPDENWLKAALSIKKDKDFYGQNIISTTLTDAAMTWIDGMNSAGHTAGKLTDIAVTNGTKKMFGDKTLKIKQLMSKKTYNVNENTTLLASDKTSTPYNTYVRPILEPFIKAASVPDVVTDVSVCEEVDASSKKLNYQIIMSLKTQHLSTIDMEGIKEVIRDALGLSSIQGIMSDNCLIFSVQFGLKTKAGSYYIDPNTLPKLVGRKFNKKESLTDLDILNAFSKKLINSNYKSGTTQTNETLDKTYDYLDPATMQFLPYILDIDIDRLSFTLTNNFSDITLKIMDGFAPQYMGSSDITIEVSFITTDAQVVSMLNVLPAHAANIGKLYRRILSCWPIKVKNGYLQMAGINEVLIDLIEVQTVSGFHETYEVRIRMTSVDRTTRRRETLRQLESDEKTTTKASASINSYWDFENVLSMAELYPDLDLPSIKELESYGLNFIKYRNTKRAYPDPDFYMTYSFPYTAYIIKKNLKDVFYNTIFHDEGKEKSEILDETSYKFFDQMGMELYRKLDPYAGTRDAGQNEFADLFDEYMEKIDEGAKEQIKKSERDKKREIEERDCANLTDLLIYLTACDVQDGWTIKPGFTAPVVLNELNLAVEKLECSGLSTSKNTKEELHNAYAQDVFDLRKKAIQAIDDYLADPIDYGEYSLKVNKSDDNPDDLVSMVINKTVEKFGKDKKAQEILKILNPFETKFKINYEGVLGLGWDSKDPDYNKVYMLNYLSGFLYAAAKCISGEKVYNKKTKSTTWEPRQFAINGYGTIRRDDKNNKIPNCKVEHDGKPLSQAESLEEALNNGIQWGLFQIKRYRASELRRIMQPTSRVAYLPKNELPMYKDKNGKERWHPGFIDPYYNIAGYRSEIGKEYIEKIATDEGINTIAFIRNVLMHLRRMIIDGQIFSEIDVIAKDYHDIKDTIKIEPDGDDFNQAAKKSADTIYDDGGIWGLPGLMMEKGAWEGIKSYFTFDGLGKQTDIEAISGAVGSEEAAGTIMELVDNLPTTYARSFCSRLILPVVMATTEGSKEFNSLINKYDLDELNNLTVGAVITTSEPLSMVAKYCNAMSSIGMLEFSKTKTDPETTSDSQKLWNYIMKQAYTKLADDPQAYVLHSYYDMLINDKRGRLVRAFPTYYMLFIDEGRKIGSWKLFDNFYNMSAISEITVSKSRKIPADTCSFVMSNMYSSYAAAYDNTTRQQYVDVYGLRDVFDSIFCPESYVKKEDSIRRRKENLETVVLQPGVRIHVRMGYGADAAKLPIAFNGKIAEIEVNEVVQVVAQGDGHELYNPLNTLGDMDAVELTEAQSWTTMFKDIRGSMKRGGESPRNLLAKLLTAKYGGVLKTVVRDWITNERFYADNPFGIYHFGDHRFNSIFSEGETVQNLYEVCDATLLKGANELYTARENAMATPTINTPIQDKTFWDLLHLCANSGVGYMGAVRDFGMRSTVCLCKPNHYYAYGYKKIDDENGETEGKLIERRKPFQQYHYYDSYTDIVFNSIKASEKNMKTNAVGIWESTDMLWGKSQSTVGPIYLDMNIFPEYQKSMTVDTMLVSDGAGGLELNFFTHFSENWASDSNDNKVNKALAERVTTNVLRESVSNMYCGELCVLGDTSIKPYDRFYVNDVYEDMMGTMEVEGVVYSMNSATGFTTSIYPDAIVRADDNHEAARQLVNGAFFGSLVVGVGGRLGVIGTFARLDSVFISNLTKIAAGLTATPADEVLATYGATAIGQFLKIEKFSDVRSAVAAAFKGAWSVGSLMTAAALAVGCYIVANNVKSSIGSFLRNINALTVYPIMKNQRPLLAGMAGHKGSVYGYEYSEEDKEDSIQGLIYKSVEWMNGANDKFEKVFPFEIGDLIMGALTRKVDDGNGNKVSEYELAKNKWAQTLPMIDGRAQGFTYDSNMTDEEKREVFVQTLQGASSKEFSSRRQMIPALRTKWRIPNLLVSKDDATYKSYHISGVNSINGLVTNSKILDLYPIEDELEIKQAVVKNSHPVIKQLYIAHSQGNAKVQMPFESGNRIIKFFTEPKDGAYIYDLPMLQEDALMILKLILNDQALKNKEVSFLSGARINDTKAWKSTGLSFVLDCNNKKALKSALDNVIKQTSTFDAEPKPIFEYKESDGGFVIVVYAPIKN